MYLCDKCEVYLNCRDLLVLLLLVPFCRRRLGRLRKEKILMGKGVRVSIVANDGREIFGNEDFGILPSGLRSIFQQNDDDSQEAIKALGGVTNICKLLRTDPTYGIEGTASDIMKRLQTYGINHILWVPPKSFFYFVWEAMMDPLLLVLMCAALAAIGLVYIPTPEDDDECDDDELEALIEGGSIFLSVTAIILVAAFNNYHKERQFKKLQRKVQSEHHVTVIRQGKQFNIEACNVVVGDICELYAGEKVPADGLITKSQELYVDESSFTGLTRVTKKGPNNLVLIGGTYVTQGSCEMVVCAVGDQSQQGLLLTLLVPRSSYDALEVAKSSLLGSITLEGNHEDRDPEERDDKSILQKKIEKLLFIVAVAGTVCATVTIVVQMVRFSIKKFLYEQKPWSNKYLNQYLSHIIFGFSVLVLCIPEGLPLAIAITLSYAVQGMMKNNNLVRHLNSCETMGNATIICTDKTGTLTTNRMTVTNAYICGTLVKTFKLGSLRTIPDFMKELVATGLSVHISYKTTIQDGSGPVSAPLHLGSKTECALLAFVKVLGADYKKIRSKYPEDSFEKIYPFDDVKKKRSTVVKIPGLGYRAHCTGSPDVVIPQCSFIHGKDGILETFTEEMKSKMLTDVVYSMGSSGLRIICLAYREFVHSETPEVNQTAYSNNVNWNKEGDIIKNLTFVATFGMEDPIRPEVPEAIKDCHRAGIRVCMITGDSVTTAQSVATMSGIIQPGDESLVLDVKEFKKMVYVHGKFQQELFDKIWPDLKVLAGTTPNDKYTVVNGIIKSKIHNHGEVVAYTGDGSNDVPALLRADVGFSMGINGTDVAKEASDIIITDDSFESIVKAILWGRCIYDNITKFIQFMMAFNIVVLFLTLMGSIFSEEEPIKAIQILYMNLIFDSFASVSFATERPTRKLLKRKPYGRKTNVISKMMICNATGMAIYEILALIFIFSQGDRWFPKRGTIAECPTSTIAFNTFIIMTLCNEICSRKVNGEFNYFEGLHKNPTFCGVWVAVLVTQAIVIEYGGKIFGTCPLTGIEWLLCFVFGIGAFLAGHLTLSLHWIICKIVSLCRS